MVLYQNCEESNVVIQSEWGRAKSPLYIYYLVPPWLLVMWCHVNIHENLVKDIAWDLVSFVGPKAEDSPSETMKL